MSIKNQISAVTRLAGTAVPDALMVAGAGSVSFGAGMVYAPAGFIAAGVFALAAGVLLARGAK